MSAGQPQPAPQGAADVGAASEASPTPESTSAPAAPGSPTVAPPAPAAETTTDASNSALPAWWWIAAIGAALAALIGGLLFWRRRNATKAPPEIIRPVVGGTSDSVAADDLLRYLKIEVDAVRLARSMMAATLTYRVTLSNRAPEAIRNITLEGDLTSAHGRAPINEQLADALTVLPALHELDHLGAGQRKSFTGEMRLELRNVRPIRQGNIPIYIPLVRLKACAAGAEARVFTFVVGKAANVAGARLQPFRLDTPPQTFTEIDARPLG